MLWQQGFDVGVLPRLACPDGHERVPVVGRDDGDGVEILVVERPVTS